MAGKRDTFIIGNVFCKLPRRNFHCRTVIILPEKRNHGAACVSGTRIVDDGFNPIAHFYAVLAIVRSKQQQNAGTLFFRADSQMLKKIDGVIFDWPAVQRFNSDDGELRAAFLLEFGAERFQTLLCILRNDPGQIGDIAGGRNL